MHTSTQIFIGGSGRSGTSILKKMIGRHSAILALPTEMRILTDPDGLLDLVDALSTRWSPYTADMAITRFDRLMRKHVFSSRLQQLSYRLDPRRAHRRLRWKWLRRRLLARPRYFGLDFGQLGWSRDSYFSLLDEFVDRLHIGRFEGRWIGAEDRQDSVFLAHYFARKEIARLAGEFADELFSQRLIRTSKSIWCDDTPFNALYALQLSELFPRMKLIYIFRDPRDVATSYARQLWSPKTVTQAAQSLHDIFARWEDVVQNLPEHMYIKIKFEDLIDDPPREMRRICNHVGVEYEASMTSIDLLEHNIGRWRQELRDDEVKQVTDTLRNAIVQGGYAVDVS